MITKVSCLSERCVKQGREILYAGQQDYISGGCHSAFYEHDKYQYGGLYRVNLVTARRVDGDMFIHQGEKSHSWIAQTCSLSPLFIREDVKIITYRSGDLIIRGRR